MESQRRARTYRLGLVRRLINRLVKLLAPLGLAGKHTYILTVTGRKTGNEYSTPVRLVEDDDRWLVAPYGEVGWVPNARAAGEVTVRRARRSERLQIEEVPAEVAAPILREYIKQVPVTRPFFEVDLESPLDQFVSEAPRHPVFRLTALG